MFDWDQANERKIAAHRITKAEVREAFTDPYRLGRSLGFVNGEERHLLIGASATGRVIKAIYTYRGSDIRVVTAYPISRGGEFRVYRAQAR
jgi:uncharacterized DUF497 family protein